MSISNEVNCMEQSHSSEIDSRLAFNIFHAFFFAACKFITLPTTLSYIILVYPHIIIPSTSLLSKCFLLYTSSGQTLGRTDHMYLGCYTSAHFKLLDSLIKIIIINNVPIVLSATGVITNRLIKASPSSIYRHAYCPRRKKWLC